MHPCRRSCPSWKKTTKASCGILPVFLISCDMNRKPERMIEEKDSQKAERSINNCLCFFLSRIFQMKSEYLYEYLNSMNRHHYLLSLIHLGQLSGTGSFEDSFA